MMADNAPEKKSYKAGHVIFRQGDIAQSCYLVSAGELELSRADSGGEDKKFAKVSKGEIVGEMSMIGDTPRTATATVSKDVEMVEISRDDFEAQLGRLNPFMQRLIRLIVQRLHDTTTTLTRG
ncbi:MAG: cyclic nucleotide-binding domain-containing protein [Alphaproteobacteria bacterium]|nr:cyclic nucleotide-binding domain-containing protein [Alphaproteobacteria bacterium]